MTTQEQVAAGSLVRKLVPIDSARVLDRLDEVARSRLAFWLTVGLVAGLNWVAPRLPMVDLPQHAAQLALWRDLLLGTSPWSDLVEINLGTPYLVGYFLALPLALVMSCGGALALVLSAAMVGFVAAAVAVRREAGADERMDWLFVTSFYGLAWKWGYYPFLVASPFVLVLLLLAMRHTRSPSFRTAAGIVLTGSVLLFAHGMAFLFACAAGGVQVLLGVRSWRDLPSRVAPFAVLGVALVAFMLASRGFGTPVETLRFTWQADIGIRVLSLVALNHGFTTELVLMSVGLLFLPMAMGLRLQGAAIAPLLVLIIWACVVPTNMFGAVHWGERFGMFAMPFFALLWRKPDSVEPRSPVQGLSILLVISCWASVALAGWRIDQFRRESSEFESILAAAPANARALAVTVDYNSPAMLHPFLYMHYAVWYQAEKSGLVDFNFSNLHNLIVTYRAERRPPLHIDFPWMSHTVDWQRDQARDYDLYFVRHGALALPAAIMQNGECLIEPIATSGAWTLLKRGACRP